MPAPGHAERLNQPAAGGSLDEFLRQRLAETRQRNLTRRRRVVEGGHGVQLRVDGQDCLNFCSNDYLGLATEPALVRHLQEAAASRGVGSGASAYVTGYNASQRALEEELAEFTGRSRALLFASGYMANLGVISTLMRVGDEVLEDWLNHASLYDGARLSGAQLTRYAHADPEDLARQLAAGQARHRLLATDAVFSMDGDMAPLPALAQLAARHDAWLMVDDAHGFGVLGPQGRGSLALHHLGEREVPVLMATLGKSLGGFGAFVAGSDDLIEVLVQRARTAIFTTAPPPAVTEAMRCALRLLREGDARREQLQALITRFRRGARQLGLPVSDSVTAIQPLIVGSEAGALQLSAALQARGFLVGAIRPPTVPVGSSRLRITLSAAHEARQVDALLDALAAAWQGLRAADGG